MALSRLTITVPSPGSSDSRSSKAPTSAASAGVRWISARMFMVATSSRLFDDPGIAVLFEFERQRLVARLDDLSFVEDMHAVRHDVLEQALVVGDDDDGAVGRTQRVDTVRNDLE